MTKTGSAGSNPVIVIVSADALAHAMTVGQARHTNGTSSRPLNSGRDALRGDQVGAIGEVAVATHYGLDPKEAVVALADRPGAIPDLIIFGRTVSVKSTELWRPMLTLYVPSHDRNEIHILVSVTYDTGRCALLGWASRADLARYPPKAWQGSADTPGATRTEKRWHYVPSDELRPCRGAAGRAPPSPVSSKDRPDQSPAALRARSIYITANEAWQRACTRALDRKTVARLRRKMGEAGSRWEKACNP